MGGLGLRIRPFVFSWAGQFERACALEAAVGEAFGPVTVINAEDGRTRPGWVDVGAEAFMAAQFRRALDLFLADPAAEAMFHLQADAAYDDWGAIAAAARDAFAAYRWGVFAPNVDYTFHKARRVDVGAIRVPHAGLRVVACTDSICWFVHRDVAQALQALQPALHATRYGWGLDVLAAAVAFVAGRPVLRDYSYTVRHPRGTGYAQDAAAHEMVEMFKGLPAPLRVAAHRIHHPEAHDQLVGYLTPPA